MTLEELDEEIANVRSVLGGLKIIGTNDPAEMRGLIEYAMELQRQRVKLAAA